MRAVKKYLLLTLLIVGLVIGTSFSAKAQSIELLGGNTLDGAMNGVILGGATMAIKNTDNMKPVQVALGAGTLYGMGVGIYDVSHGTKGQQFYISGTFNDGENSTIIVLLDTFYGTATGAIIASSVSLIIQEPLLDALQYGSGIGAWAGFGFGLFDAFLMSKGGSNALQARASQSDISGLLTYTNQSRSLQVGMLNPELITQKKINSRSIELDYSPAVDLVNLQVHF